MANANINADGAPIAIRMQLASAKPEQRKSILSRYFNQAFTAEEMLEANPGLDIKKLGGMEQLFYVDNGEMKLVDPPGFIQSMFPPKIDVGDIAEAGRDVASTVGGGLSGTAALLAGQAGPQALLPEEIYTVPAAAALGAETAGNLYDMSVAAMTPGGIDRGTPTEQMTRTAGNLALETAGGRLADMATRGVKTGIQRGVQKLSGISPGQRAEDFTRLGVQPTAAMLTGRPSVGQVEEALASFFTASDIIRTNRNRVIEELGDAANKISRKFGDPQGSPEVIGSAIRTGAIAAKDRIKTKQSQLYDAAYDAAGQISIPMGSLRALQAELKTELAAAPNALKDQYAPAIRQLDVILKDADAAGGQLDLRTARSIRTNIGKAVGSTLPGQTVRVFKAGDEKLPSIYSALSKDIDEAVQATSPQAARLLRRANDYTRQTANDQLKTIDKIARQNLDSQVFSFAMQEGKRGGQRIRDVFKVLSKPERDAVSASVMGRMGIRGSATEGGGEWSANVFLTNWRNMDKRSKNILFGAPRFAEVRKELDSLARLAEVAAENIGEINRSRSGVTGAGFVQIASTGAAILTAGGLLADGDITGAGGATAAAGAALLSPRYAAKLMTSPKFIRWLKTTAQATNRGVNPLSVQLGRLAVLPGKDGELAEAVNAFVSNLQANIAGQ
tara:strand:- start:1764 stop:3782 length:2019 start_codon:yes stop_codon:yes gene_type:complete